MKSRKRGILAGLGVAMLLVTGAMGQTWQVDDRFQPALEYAHPDWMRPVGVMSLPGGNVLISGSYESIDGVRVRPLERMRPDGTIDGTFALSDYYIDIKYIYPDGRLLVTRGTTTVEGYHRITLERLLADGSNDDSFQRVEFTAGGGPNSIAVGPDGRIWAVGHFREVSGQAINHLVALQPDGRVVPGYVSPLHADASVYQVVVHEDGRPLIAGPHVWLLAGGETKRLIRLHLDGSFDPEFQPLEHAEAPGIVVPVGNDFVLYTQGRHLRRLRANGELDESFVREGPEYVKEWRISGDGRLLYGQVDYDSEREAILRWHLDGRLDAGFLLVEPPRTSYLSYEGLSTFSTWSGDVHYLAGPLTLERLEQRQVLSKLQADGTPDASFAPRISLAAELRELQRLPDGNYLVAGRFDRVNGMAAWGLARLTPDGQLDASFAPEFQTEDFVSGFAVLPDGKTMVWGVLDGLPVVRLNPDGTRDSAYHFVGQQVSIQAVDPSGRIYALSADSSLLRYDAGGAIDVGFQCPFPVAGVWVTVDGKTIVRKAGSIGRSEWVRLLADGSLDPSYREVVIQNSPIEGTTVLPDGRLLVVRGSASGYTWSFQRYDQDGFQDWAFTVENEGGNSWMTGASVMLDLLLESGGESIAMNLRTNQGQTLLRVHRSGEVVGGYIQNGGSTWRAERLEPASYAPVIRTQPAGSSVDVGDSMVFAVSVQGLEPFTYEWSKDGVPIPNSNRPFIVIARAAPADSGTYSVRIGNTHGEVVSAVAILTVLSRPSSQLMNVSMLGQTGPDGEVMIAGFVLHGDTPREVLVRAVGPTLSEEPFEVSGMLPATRLTLFREQTPIGEFGAWEQQPNAVQIEETASRVGAFPLLPDSPDAAMLITLEPGVYSVHASGAGEARGSVLVEVYDAGEPSVTGETRLVNISTLGTLVHAGDSMHVGFVVAGEKPKTVLVRAVGPSLRKFELEDVLEKPHLGLYGMDDGQPVMIYDENGGWADDPQLAAAAAQAHAFPLLPGSRDAAVLVTLPPGVYSAVIFGQEGSTGRLIAEVYEVED